MFSTRFLQSLPLLLVLVISPGFAAETAPSPALTAEDLHRAIAGALDPDRLRVSDPDASTPAAVGVSLLDGISERQREVHEISWPMLITAAAEGLCDGVGRTGVLLATVAPQTASGQARIEHVANGSPAAAAGLQRGDLLVEIAGKRVKRGDRATRQLDDAAGADGETIQVIALRNGQPLPLLIGTVEACPLSVSLFDHAGGLFAPGEAGRIQIDGSLYEAATDLAEKRIVVAHHIAHHLGGHVATRSALHVAGRLLDRAVGFAGVSTLGIGAMAGSMVTKPGDEAEADTLSLRILSPLGIDSASVLAFWERVDTQPANRGLLQFTAAHPMTAGRMDKLRARVARASMAPAVVQEVGD